MADTVKGVDISVHNGDVDFEMLKRNGISFVMIGMGNRFAENVQKAEAARMPWGGYFYTDSVSPAEDEEELAKILDRLKGKRPTYPIAIDVEDDGTKAAKGGWNYANVNRNAKFLLEGLEKAGYYPMLYTGFEEIENYIDESVWRKYDMWWAQWATRCGYPGDNLGMWQFGGKRIIFARLTLRVRYSTRIMPIRTTRPLSRAAAGIIGERPNRSLIIPTTIFHRTRTAL